MANEAGRSVVACPWCGKQRWSGYGPCGTCGQTITDEGEPCRCEHGVDVAHPWDCMDCHPLQADAADAAARLLDGEFLVTSRHYLDAIASLATNPETAPVVFRWLVEAGVLERWRMPDALYETLWEDQMEWFYIHAGELYRPGVAL